MYLDSSVVVKLFIPEPESETYLAAVMKEPAVSSMLAQPEVSSALFRKEREGQLLPEERLATWNVFIQSVQDHNLRLMPLNDEVCLQAVKILEDYHRLNPKGKLRTLDSIHLATCLLHLEFPLVTNDKDMKTAAQHLRIPLLNSI